MRYIINNSTNPYFNIALEEYCLMNVDVGEDYFILWQNEPSIIIGRNQNPLEEINMGFVEENQIKVVRRISGGGAVYHDLGNLNFTFITELKSGEKPDFRVIAEPIIRILRQLGVDAMIMGRNDIIAQDKKISGNAQRLYKKRLMQHGTLLFDLDIDALANALTVSMDKIESKGIKSIRSRVGNIRELLNKDMTVDEFKSILHEKLSDGLQSEEIVLTSDDLKKIEEAAKSKFMSWEWTYGETPQFNYRSDKRFPAGKIGVLLQIKNGLINSCSFYGDYLALTDTKAVADHLIGLPYEETRIGQALAEEDLELYFGSITPTELLEVFFDHY